MTSETRLELQRLLSALCDGELSEAQQARLEELLDADADCRCLYLEYVDMHARLLIHPRLPGMSLLSTEGGAGVSSSERITEAKRHDPSEQPLSSPAGRRRGGPQIFRYIVVATATLAASFLIQVLWSYTRMPGRGRADMRASEVVETPVVVKTPLTASIATLTQLADCVWEEPAGAPRVGLRLPPSRLRLRSGIARVRIDGGPDLVIEGPADLRLDSGMAATVSRGKVVFLADETAAPFELQTPSSTLVDLGTEYAVAVGPEGEEVHVFAGEVQRTPRTTGAASSRNT